MSSERDLKAEEYALYKWPIDAEDEGLYCLQEEYPRDFRMRAWNSFLAGWDQALQSEEVNKLREENLIMREALEFYAQALNTNNEVMGEPNPEAHLMPRRLGTFAHETLEKVK